MFKYLLKSSDRRLAFAMGLVIFLGVLLVFLPIVLYGINQVSTEGEIRYTRLEVIRANRLLQHELNRLDQTLLDWASWDDTYAFAEVPNQEFLDNNLNNDTFSNITVDICLIINNKGDLTYTGFFSKALSQNKLFDIQTFLDQYSTFIKYANLSEGNRGFALISDVPVMAAARPIFNSQGKGPAHGTLVFIRLLDEQMFEDYSNLSLREVSIYPAAIQQPISTQLSDPKMAMENIQVRARDDYIVQGYQYLPDLNGQPLLLLIIENQRDLYNQGRSTAWVFSISMVVLAFVLFALAYRFAGVLLELRRQGRQYLKRFMAIIEQSREAILLVSEDFTVLEANRASMQLLGWERSITRPNNLKRLVRFTPPLEDATLLELCNSERICEYHCTRRDGQTFDIELSASEVQDGNAHAFSLILRDITERKLLEARLRYDALHDPLTGLGNRSLLLEHLNHINARKQRHPDLLYGLLFIDFDGFKQINDTIGHWAGDLLLVEAARRLESNLRPADVVTRIKTQGNLVRIAGDEFVVLVDDIKSEADISRVAEHVCHCLAQPYDIQGKEVSLTASIGLVIPDRASINVEDIIRDADIAMYRAKHKGGGQVVRFHPEMYRAELDRMELELDMRRGIENREFVVYYQPIYHLGSGRIHGLEALVRWNHPTRGLLSPSAFIELAEHTGLIVPLGSLVLEEACATVQTWKQKTRSAAGLTISVNLAAQQINSGLMVGLVRDILARTGFDPASLWLEVTESNLISSEETVLSQLTALRAMGLRLAIDDFGQGYSALSYLQNLPLDGFKLDRSFIKDINGDGKQIVRSLVDLGHGLGLKLVAEGVETVDQLRFLKQVGCDFAQGYLMSRPVSAKEAWELILADKTHHRAAGRTTLRRNQRLSLEGDSI